MKMKQHAASWKRASLALALCAVTSVTVLSAPTQAKPGWGNNKPGNHKPGWNKPGNRWNRNITITGIVADRKSNQRFTVWANGRKYNVLSDKNVPGRLDNKDKVQVSGRMEKGTLKADWVKILKNR